MAGILLFNTYGSATRPPSSPAVAPDSLSVPPMSLNIRSMRLVSNGSGRATTEILISDHANDDMAVESLRICVTIPLAEINVKTAEQAAMKRTRRICEDIERCLSESRVSGAQPVAEVAGAKNDSTSRPPNSPS